MVLPPFKATLPCAYDQALAKKARDIRRAFELECLLL